jgi:hypothetical protein
VAKLLGTDINRHLADILTDTNYQIKIKEPVLFKVKCRIILIQTPSGKKDV